MVMTTCLDEGTDMRRACDTDICSDMCTDMCVDVCRHVYRHVYKHLYFRGTKHVVARRVLWKFRIQARQNEYEAHVPTYYTQPPQSATADLRHTAVWCSCFAEILCVPTCAPTCAQTCVRTCDGPVPRHRLKALGRGAHLEYQHAYTRAIDFFSRRWPI